MMSALLLRLEPLSSPANQPAELKNRIEHSEQILRIRMNSNQSQHVRFRWSVWKTNAQLLGDQRKDEQLRGLGLEEGTHDKDFKELQGGWEVVERPAGESAPQKEIVLHHVGSTKNIMVCRSHLHTKKRPREIILRPPNRREHQVGANSCLFQLRRL